MRLIVKAISTIRSRSKQRSAQKKSRTSVSRGCCAYSRGTFHRAHFTFRNWRKAWAVSTGVRANSFSLPNSNAKWFRLADQTGYWACVCLINARALALSQVEEVPVVVVVVSPRPRMMFKSNTNLNPVCWQNDTNSWTRECSNLSPRGATWL